MGYRQGGEKPGHGRQQHQLQWQTEHQAQGVHFQFGERVRRLNRSHHTLTQESQKHQAGEHEESFRRVSIGGARAVGQGVPSSRAAVQDHDRRRPNQDAIEHCHDHLG